MYCDSIVKKLECIQEKLARLSDNLNYDFFNNCLNDITILVQQVKSDVKPEVASQIIANFRTKIKLLSQFLSNLLINYNSEDNQELLDLYLSWVTVLSLLEYEQSELVNIYYSLLSELLNEDKTELVKFFTKKLLLFNFSSFKTILEVLVLLLKETKFKDYLNYFCELLDCLNSDVIEYFIDDESNLEAEVKICYDNFFESLCEIKEVQYLCTIIYNLNVTFFLSLENPTSIFSRCYKNLEESITIKSKLTWLHTLYHIRSHKNFHYNSHVDFIQLCYNFLVPEIFIENERSIIFQIILQNSINFDKLQLISFFKKLLQVAAFVPVNCAVLLLKVVQKLVYLKNDVFLPLIHISEDYNYVIEYKPAPTNLDLKLNQNQHSNLTPWATLCGDYSCYEINLFLYNSNITLKQEAQRIIGTIIDPYNFSTIDEQVEIALQQGINKFTAKYSKTIHNIINKIIIDIQDDV